MSKDLFNGNIKKEYENYVKFTLVIVSVLFFVFFLFFLIVALAYKKIEYAARLMMFVMSGLSFLASFAYPILSIYAIQNYSKHPRLAKLMIKPFVFQDFEADMIQHLITRDLKKGSKNN